MCIVAGAIDTPNVVGVGVRVIVESSTGGPAPPTPCVDHSSIFLFATVVRGGSFLRNVTQKSPKYNITHSNRRYES